MVKQRKTHQNRIKLKIKRFNSEKSTIFEANFCISMDITSLFKYFSELSDKQKEQYNQLKDLYLDWNSKINVISRRTWSISMSIMCCIR